MKPAQISKTLRQMTTFKSRKDNVYTFIRSYYYRHGMTGESFANTTVLPVVTTLLPGHNIKIIDHGDHYHGFCGGAKPGSAKDSYFYAKLEITESPAAQATLNVPDSV